MIRIDPGSGAQTVVSSGGRLLSPVAIAIVPSSLVPLDLSIRRAEVEREEDEAGGASAEVRGRFVLGPASDGIDPENEDVILQLGTFSGTLEAGSIAA